MKDKGTTYKKGTTKLRITHLPEIKRVCLVLEKDRQQELLAYFKTEEKAKKFIETIDYFMEDKGTKNYPILIIIILMKLLGL